MVNNLFQSTHPSGVRPEPDISWLTDFLFQSTHPSGVRPLSWSWPTGSPHFNPRTPVGCDVQRFITPPASLISIHAPQWGATRNLPDILQQQAISIHAPQWGATYKARFYTDSSNLFQSTHPSGVRPGVKPVIVTTLEFQSTHPSGVRHGVLSEQQEIFEFQSTHPSGVRLKPDLSVLKDMQFQSTHPSGVRLGI